MKNLSFLLIFSIFQVQPMEFSPENILSSLTLDQKIAQLFMLAVVADEAINKSFMADSPYRMDQNCIKSMIQKYGVGGIVFLGNGTPETVRTSIERFQCASAIPLLVAIDAEWGLNMRLKDTLRFPRALTLGALAPKKDTLINSLGYIIGASCKELGIDINFAPVADVNNNPKNPIIGNRSFGEDPELVARKASAFAAGLADAGIIACAKHFPGHGDTEIDSHVELPTIQHSRAHLDAIELYPFKKLIAQQIPAIMTGHLDVTALDEVDAASMSKKITTDLLRNELGFEGLIITDGLGMGAVTKRHNTRELDLKALLAGNDILLGVRNAPLAISRIKHAIKEGRITEKEIDTRVLKILRAKTRSTNGPCISQKKLNAEHIKKALYFNAITLVKNNKNILPLKAGSVLEIGTIGTNTETKFSTIMKKYTFNEEDASTIILAIYPQSRSAMIEEWHFHEESGEEVSLGHHIRELQEMGKTIITVLFGSPYTIAQVSDSDAILCAYEDDEDAQHGAALALLGFYNPSGRLPVSAAHEFPVGTGFGY